MLYKIRISSIKNEISLIKSSEILVFDLLRIVVNLSFEFELFITGITGIIKSKNFVLSLFINISSFIAYTKTTSCFIFFELFISWFNSLNFTKISDCSNLSKSSIKTTSYLLTSKKYNISSRYVFKADLLISFPISISA